VPRYDPCTVFTGNIALIAAAKPAVVVDAPKPRSFAG
jgi:hypothetical protein